MIIDISSRGRRMSFMGIQEDSLGGPANYQELFEVIGRSRALLLQVHQIIDAEHPAAKRLLEISESFNEVVSFCIFSLGTTCSLDISDGVSIPEKYLFEKAPYATRISVFACLGKVHDALNEILTVSPG